MVKFNGGEESVRLNTITGSFENPRYNNKGGIKWVTAFPDEDTMNRWDTEDKADANTILPPPMGFTEDITPK